MIKDGQGSMKPGASRPRARVTIKDVALAAKVSPMTVSNVINGRLQFVSTATQETVQREIERLGYRVQKAGRNLRRSSQQAIGMVIVDDSPSFLADPFTGNVAAGLSNSLSAQGFSLAIQGVKVAAFSEATFHHSLEVDAVCAVLSGPKDKRSAMVDALLQHGQPVVLFQEQTTRHSPDLCTVRQDDEGGARLITHHVIERGAQHILFISTQQEWPAMLAREAGVHAELKASGNRLWKLDSILCATEDYEVTQAALARHLDLHGLPDTIIGGNDRLALAAMALLLERGIEVPRQVRVAGFNGFEPRRYARPLLTTVISPAYQMGEAAAKLILDRLTGALYPSDEIVLPVSLEIGDST